MLNKKEIWFLLELVFRKKKSWPWRLLAKQSLKTLCMLAWSLSLVLLPSTEVICELLSVVISGPGVCWKGLCSETRTDLNCSSNITLRSLHFLSPASPRPSLIAHAKLDGEFFAKLLMESFAWWERDRLSTRWRHSVRLGLSLLPTACSRGSVHRRCHWNTLEITRDWPRDLDLCTVLHVVVPHSYVQHHWKHSMLC